MRKKIEDVQKSLTILLFSKFLLSVKFCEVVQPSNKNSTGFTKTFDKYSFLEKRETIECDLFCALREGL